MGKRGLSFFKTMIVVLAAMTILSLFQNCGDVKLSRPLEQPPYVNPLNGKAETILPLPHSNDNDVRIVFLVDMSVSMVHGLCKDDAASDAKDQANVCEKSGIVPGQGVDVDGDRFEMIRTWITEINANSKYPERVKYLVVPFNGTIGKAQPDQNFLSFNQAAQALDLVDELKKWQSDSYTFYSTLSSLANQISESGIIPYIGKGTKMSTTAPSDRLAAVQSLMVDEAARLNSQSLSSFFELVILSDGVAKPRAKHFKKAIRQFWKMADARECTITCGDYADRYIDGLLDANTPDCNALTLSTPREWIYCFGELRASCYGTPVGGGCSGELRGVNSSLTARGVLEKARETWGDYKKNTPNKIATQVRFLQKAVEQTGNANVRISSVLINPLKLSAENLVDNENFVLRLQSTKVAQRTVFTSSNNTPFSLINKGDDLESFKISSVIVWNPVNRVDKNGRLIIDSDSDGLPDSEESKFGLLPNNPRSNGRCLDKLTAMGLCSETITCDPKLDADSDGLNECEEIILGTNPNDFDTDGDGIPDGIEFLLGSDPLKNDLIKDDNLDGLANTKNLLAGAHPAVNLKKINPKYLVDYALTFLDYVQLGEKQPKTSKYVFEIKNVPTTASLKVVTQPLFTNSSHSKNSETKIQIIGASKEKDQSAGLILIRVDNVLHNGDVHWAYLPVIFGKQNALEVKFEDLQYLNIPDTQGSIQ